MTLRVLGCNQDVVEVAVKNTGGQSGLIADAKLEKWIDGNRKEYDLLARPEGGAVIVDPGKVVLAKYKAYLGSDEMKFPIGPEGTTCRLDLAVRMSKMVVGESVEPVRVSCACAR
jgi:hypothetical protein